MYCKKARLVYWSTSVVGAVLKTTWVIIQHPPFWDYDTWWFKYNSDWGCMQQHIMITRSLDSPGQQFLDLLDQASWCHASMARSLWLHRCGIGCCRHWCWCILLNSWHGGDSWSLFHLGCWCCRCSRCGLHAWCRWGHGAGCATKKQWLDRACSVAAVPLGTVLAALTLCSWRCLCMQQYVEPLLVCILNSCSVGGCTYHSSRNPNLFKGCHMLQLVDQHTVVHKCFAAFVSLCLSRFRACIHLLTDCVGLLGHCCISWPEWLFWVSVGTTALLEIEVWCQLV